MPRFTIKDGNLSAESYVKAAGEYTCPKGTTTKFVLDWPEGMTVTSTINVNNVKCGCCGETAVLPQGNYSVKGGVLVRENTASA